MFLKTLWQGTCNESQKPLKSGEKYFYPSLSSVSFNFSRKKSFLVTADILGPLVNKLTTANYEYSRSYKDNLQLPVQIQLSAKLAAFSGVFIAIAEPALNFEHFGKKKQPHG